MFSIIIPLYNKAKHIGDTISSVLNQSFKSFEIIVVNNNSEDNGVEIVKGIDDSRIIIVNELNQGVSYARNFGVKVAKYDWVCFLDADDIWEKDNLLMFSQEIFQFSELDVVGNLYKIIEPNGVSRTCKKNPLNYFDGRYKLNNFFDDFLFGDMPLNMSSFCLSKDVFNKIGGFNTDIRIGEDTLFLMHLFLSFKIHISNYVGSTYNRQATNRSNNANAFKLELPVLKLFQDIYKNETKLHLYEAEFKSFIAKHIFACIVANLKAGDLATARRFYRDSRVFNYPFKFKLLAAFFLTFIPPFLNKILLRLQ
jgi:glycosyltransferase involved in cell wall biosynthesis